eukprot:TRINITY_DN9452_c0_g1_i1.p1 TRINITY_DN9452_c0_g1~~TRINITY_DN9452_c0_g1_i1.p1  ORF type:complete len:126 (+),score=70.25 TRINITY_DN9452_c0_g1_i1:316-693(+)
MNVRGIPRAAEPVRSQAYHTLQLSNHWAPSDARTPQLTPGAPGERWLQLYAFDVDSKKKRRFAFEHHVGSVELEADAKRPFDLLLDSVHYGPLLRVVIKPLDLPDDDGSFALPVATFLPPMEDLM